MNEKTTSVSMKKGRAALLLALILALALIAVNLLVDRLPSDTKNLDLTKDKIYSVSDSTKRNIAKIKEDVSVYLVAVNGEAALSDEGVHLHTFLANAAAVSKKISYSVVDPVKDTAWLEKYEFAAEMANLSVVVESARRAYHIPCSELFSYYVDGVGKIAESEAMYYYYYGYTPYYCFDGEARLLAALTNVTDPDVAVIYALSGHSEPELSSSAANMMKNAGISPKALDLSSGAPVPEDCDLLIINAPQADITAAEATLLCNYLARGGAIFLATSPEITSMTNLLTVTTYMSMHGLSGIVTEEDSQYYYSASYPYYLKPQVGTHAVTESAASILLPFAHGIGFSATLPAGHSVAPLLFTSEKAYAIPLDATTPEKPENAEAASFCVGAVSEAPEGGRLIWIPCTNFFSDTADGMSEGGNSALFTSAVKWTCGSSAEAPTAAILPLVTETLTVNQTTARLLSLMLTVVMPLAIVALGIFCSIRRKRR